MFSRIWWIKFESIFLRGLATFFPVFFSSSQGLFYFFFVACVNYTFHLASMHLVFSGDVCATLRRLGYHIERARSDKCRVTVFSRLGSYLADHSWT